MPLAILLAAVLGGPALGQAPPPAEPSLLRPALPADQPAKPSSVRKRKPPLSPLKSTALKPTIGVAAPVPLVPASTPAGLGVVPAVKPLAPLPPPAETRRRKPRPDEDPWAPLGTEVLGLVLKPSVVIDAGYDSNPNQSSGPHRGSSAIATAAALEVRSDWVRHSFTANLRGALFRFPDVPAADRPASDSTATLRLDVLRDTVLELGATNVITTQRPGSVEQPELSSKRALVDTVGGTVGLEQHFGAASLQAKGNVGRSVYQDVTLGNGTVLSQADRDYDIYGGLLRASYEATPGVKPFVQATLDQRRYDLKVDAGGYERSSVGYTASVGSSFELSRLLTGEIAAGYGERRYEDPRLVPLKGPIVESSLIWTATALTTVKLRAATNLEETSVANASGAVAQSVGIEIEHALRRNLILTTAVGFTRTEYQGAAITENAWSVGARLEYKLTRSLALRASAVQQRLHSTSPGNDYTANVFLVGLKLQH